MLSVILALIGVPVGLALDALVVRLAVPPDQAEPAEADDGDAPGEAAEPRRRPLSSLHAEAGSLVLATPASALGGWARRLLIVGATAGLFAVAADRYDEAGHLAIIAPYVCVLLVCAATDALSYRVPNVVTYPAMLGALVVGAAMPDADLLKVIAGGVLAGGVLFLPALFTGGLGMGMGDVKLIAFVGLALGFENLAPALLVMAVLGGGAATLLLLTGLRKRGEPIPYAPFISIGALVALLWQGAAFVDLA